MSQDPRNADALDDADEATLLRRIFLGEAADHLREVTAALHTLVRIETGDPGATRRPLDDLLRALHTMKSSAASVGFEAIAGAVHDLEDLCAELSSGALALTPGIADTLEEGLGTLRALVDGEAISPGRPRPASPAADPVPPQVQAERRRGADRRTGYDRRASDKAVRVAPERLDALLDEVGDLVILRTRIERRVLELEGVLRDLHAARATLRVAAAHAPVPAGGASPNGLIEVERDFTSGLAHLDRATRALRSEGESMRRTTEQLEEHVRQARLQPLEALYVRLGWTLTEIVAAAPGDKRAGLFTSGGDIALDKNVLDKLHEPLLHLLRNAFVHGIEPPDERRTRGKPSEGRIEIRTRAEGDLVLIELHDDGAGLDRAKLRDALVHRGRIGPADEPKDEVLRAAVFEPGLSTRRETDTLAGRGLGLAIVKRALGALGGEVSIDDDPGVGTTVRLSVPQHASITQAVLFKAAGHVYAIPAAHVVEVLPLGPDDLMVKDGLVEGLPLRHGAGARVPLLRLGALLGVEAPPDRRGAVLHLRYGGRGVVMTCDKIIGPRTIVVRPLGPLLEDLTLFAGVAISGAGKAQLVLETAAVVEAAYGVTKPAPPPAPRRSAPRVLVVDDSRLARESVARALVSAGFHPVMAEDGWEAWDLLGARRFDAVVTDLEMPRVDGFELVARIRKEPTLRELPVVVLSSRSSETARTRALATGANVVLTKGAQKRAVGEAVRGLLGRG